MVFKTTSFEDIVKKDNGKIPEGGNNHKNFQEVIRKLCNDSAFRASVKRNPEILSGYEFTPFQITALIGVGHASGQSSFAGATGFCCCCGPDDMTPNLGPLTSLAGTWEGDEGYDTAPSKNRGIAITRFREQIKFEPLDPVYNHDQILYGLRYSTKAWRLDEENPFHEEVGYWLWDPRAKQVLRCFIVPRGVTVIAGGTVEPDAKTFELVAEVGSETYGVCSNRFLDKEFKTVRYQLKVMIHDKQHFCYEEDTQLKIKGLADIFHHTDKNTLFRTK